MKQTLATIRDAKFGISTDPPEYTEWSPGLTVEVGGRYSHKGVAYQVIQAHSTQGNWRPANTPALFKVLRRPFDAWVQPAGEHDAYNAVDGDNGTTAVIHNGKRWLNTHGDGNVWEPGVFGWVETDKEPVMMMWVENEGDETVGITISTRDYERRVNVPSGTHEIRLEGKWDSLPEVSTDDSESGLEFACFYPGGNL